jgi:FAD/FMN-containing dehydrogenase
MAAGLSWGRYPRATQQIIPLYWRDAVLPDVAGTVLPYGNGRSYGDVCLNDGGALLHTRGLDRLIAFDSASGILRCESGVLFADILAFAVPRGWFLPVTPGTQYITIGGAIANDVHGKNHHRAGTFGEQLRCFELLRSDGSRVLCSRAENAGLFAATIAGLGLTGLVTWAEFALKRIAGAWMSTQTLTFNGLPEFFALSTQSEHAYEYTVAWIDCAGSGKTFGRGLFIRANHAEDSRPLPRTRQLRVPFTPPFPLVNRATLHAFNALYFHGARRGDAVMPYRPYFYPLDAVDDWNRIYGPRGFLQYQCVVPPAQAEDAIAELLRTIAASGAGSFLSVLKVFSDRPAAGILSFPRAGTTLALDFPNRGSATFDLLERLDDVVVAAGGAVYPAKDARLRAERFRRYFPRWEEMQAHVDPRFSSGFWRRVTQGSQ